MSEINMQEAEARSLEFVKIATFAALHIQAVNSALEAGDLESLKGSIEFGEKVSKAVLSQVPQEIQMEVLLDLLGSVMGA
ncbi:hypothetical protein SEA_MOAB_200 [Streptomyces phage Moab]|nr:hypothetical protein SEA_MOAB_200 [Streptomyces phage Moab]WMI33804.1 hypothetical protein SEA_PATELGO_202 [Streptomyces phage Patelgo]